MRSMLVFAGISGLLAILFTPAKCPAITLDEAMEYALTHNPKIIQQQEHLKAKSVIRGYDIMPENPHFFIEVEDIPKNSPISAYGHRKAGFSQRLNFPLVYFLNGRQARNQELQKEIFVKKL